MTTRVLIVATGCANVASVRAALERLGVGVDLGTSAAEVDRAGLVVLPGVGAFGAAMDQLDAAGLVQPFRARILKRRPTLAICLGLQLLGADSEESPGRAGVGAVSTSATRFRGACRVPQVGWNLVTASRDCRLLADGHAYFANSFRIAEPPAGFAGATSDHDGPFVAAFEDGPVLACQFHPELSGAWGRDLLARWIAAGERAC